MAQPDGDRPTMPEDGHVKGRASHASDESVTVSEELGDIYFSCEAYTQAETQFRQVLAVLEPCGGTERTAALRLKIARCLHRQGRTTEVLAELDRAAVPLANAPAGARGLRGRVAATYALVHRQLGEYEAASRRCREAIELLQGGEDEVERAEAELCLGTVCLRQGNLAEAERWYKRALVGMSRSASGEGMIKALNNLGLVHRNLGHWDRAADYFQRGIEAAERLGHYSTIAVCSSNLGLVHFHRGDWSRATACFQRSLGIFREVGHTLGVVSASLGLGRIHLVLREWDAARTLLEEAHSLARQRRLTREQVVSLEFLGDYHLERGDLAAAETCFRDGLRMAAGFAPRSDHVAELSRRMGELELARGNAAAAIAHLQETLSIAREIHDRREEAITLRTLGEAYAILGDAPRARARLGEAMEKLRRLGDRFELGKALIAAGTVLADVRDGFVQDDDPAARRHSAMVFFRESREIFQALGVRYLAARAHMELSRWEAPGEPAPRESAPVPSAPHNPRSARLSLRDEVTQLERVRILETLEEFAGNQSRAAAALGLTRKGLLGKMQRYSIRAAQAAS